MQHVRKHQQLPLFMQQQYAFAAYIRDPQHAAAPDGIAARRMDTYVELFYNNIHETLSNAFPVLRGIHNEVQWHDLVRDYYAGHRARTPLFHEMPREFVYYLAHERDSRINDYPFLLELAHYEWIELELLTTEEAAPAHHNDGDLLQGAPLLSPLSRLLSYHYAVHKIGPQNLPEQTGDEDTHLLVYRDAADKIGFIELNPITARLLQLIQARPQQSGQQLLESIAAELSHPNPQTVIDGGRQILDGLKQRNVILGTRVNGGGS